MKKISFWRKLTGIWPLVQAIVQKKYKPTRRVILALIVALLYLFSPIDIIPDFLVFLLGPFVLIDDLTIGAWMLYYILPEVQSFLQKQNQKVK